MFNPRPAQQAILAYTGGKMGIAAVPGSGKTFTLSSLAARLLLTHPLDDDQEILVVTLTNSAVDNFSQRIRGFVQEAGLLPDSGYRVRTLHGLSYDIVRERPDLVGLDNRFQIADDLESNNILSNAARVWLSAHPEFFDQYLSQDLDAYHLRNARTRDIPALLADIAHSFIRQAKDGNLLPVELEAIIAQSGSTSLLLDACSHLYAEYQRSLNYRSAVDFDDLIRLSIQALRVDPSYLQFLQHRWPFILEDEAQDSSRLQEELLRLLSDRTGNWVRVGDPNQAIYETFTTASPRFLRSFLTELGVTHRELPNSGRSSLSIIRLANHLIQWSASDECPPILKDALSLPLIEPTPLNDPKPNPPDQPDSIYFHSKSTSSEQEIDLVVRAIKKLLSQGTSETIAVLASSNNHAEKVVSALVDAGVEVVELLRSNQVSRQVIEILEAALKFLWDPNKSSFLAELFTKQQKFSTSAPIEPEEVERIAAIIQKCRNIEDFLDPFRGQVWWSSISDQDREILENFRKLVVPWQAGVLLPVDQLILKINQDLFTSSTDLALGHKIALMLENFSRVHPDSDLGDFKDEINNISHNAKNFNSLNEEEGGFNPDAYPGKVVVSTIHKAKGLEWDRVYLMSANNYDFPSGDSGDSYYSEKWFIQENQNLEAQVLAQLEAVQNSRTENIDVALKQAEAKARQEFCAERLRLLFVAITRARKEIIVTWNTGNKMGAAHEAEAVQALRKYWEAAQT